MLNMNPFGYFDEEVLDEIYEELHDKYDFGSRIDKDSMPCNKPRALRDSSDKSHVVKACGDGLPKEGKLIRFGDQNMTTAGAPKKGESEKQKARRASFRARHGANIKKGKKSAAYWANSFLW
jgi:hypothetical protein